ncbi:MAG TPA: hypothetical protein VN958_00235, partial [Chitinophagaceae bacterium]|nr:hypothetical protein [Chitinophagaceae bacterium]
METIFLITICVLLLIAIIVIIIFLSNAGSYLPLLQSKVIELQSGLFKIEINFKEDFRINREENATIAKDIRIELNTTLKNITEQSQNALREINKTLEDKVSTLITKIDVNNKTSREVLTKNISDFSGANIIQLEKIDHQAKEDSRLIREALV